MDAKIKEIINFWFDGLNDESKIDKKLYTVRRWFIKSQRNDQEIAKKFQDDVERASASYQSWQDHPQGVLALILLFDQFARNIYRGTPRSFAFDDQALKLCMDGLVSSVDQEMQLIERYFFYMPLMHAEELAVQELSCRSFQNLAKIAKSRSPQNQAYFSSSIQWAERHYDIIARFGRFPHRNEILGRDSQPEEIEFLKQPHSGF